MNQDYPFLNHLKQQRISFSQSSEKYDIFVAPYTSIPDVPLYYAEAAEDFTVSFPFHVEREGVHAFYILYTISGRGQLIYQNQTILLEPESAVFIDCRSNYRIEIYDQTPWHFKSIYLNGPSTSYYYQNFCSDNHFLSTPSPLSKVSETMDNLIDLLHSPVRNYNFHVSRLITDLLTTLIDSRDYKTLTENLIPKYVLEVKKKFDTQYSMNHSLEQLASDCRISKYQLAHEFTNHVGMSPISYLNKKRIHEAMKLLRTTDETISTIGGVVGIENTTHFINLFKKEVGVTPLQYRKYNVL